LKYTTKEHCKDKEFDIGHVEMLEENKKVISSRHLEVWIMEGREKKVALEAKTQSYLNSSQISIV
jgi:hypothetical protein